MEVLPTPMWILAIGTCDKATGYVAYSAIFGAVTIFLRSWLCFFCAYWFSRP